MKGVIMNRYGIPREIEHEIRALANARNEQARSRARHQFVCNVNQQLPRYR